MPALERLRGLRVVAEPGALDAAVWSRSGAGGDAGGLVILRIAPDEALAIGAAAVRLGDPHAIVEPDTGFVGAWLDPAELAASVERRIEWHLPAARPALAQGLAAGVPAKVWLEAGRALLVTAAPYAAELESRLW